MPHNNAEIELEQLIAAIRGLHRRQRLLRAAVGGLLWGTLLGSALVLAIRLGWLPSSPLMATLVCVGLVPLGALLTALWRRPSTLALLLDMEHQLRIRQQVSTAWEGHLGAPGTALTERLAERANKLRLTHRIGGIWPATMPESARWIPGGIAVLALCWTIAVPERGAAHAQRHASPADVDERDANRTPTPKRQWALLPPPRASRPARTEAEESEAKRRTGRTGGASRRQTLARLGPGNESLEAGRRRALRDGTQVNVAPVSQQRAVQGMAARAGAALQRLLALARAGALDESQISALDRQTLESLGIASEDLEAALRESAAGDNEAIQRLIEQAASRLSQSRSTEQLARRGGAGTQRDRRAGSNTRGEAGQRTGAGGAPGANLAGAGGAGDGEDPVDAGMFDDIDGDAGAASNAFDDSAAGGRGGGGAGSGANTSGIGRDDSQGQAATVMLQAFGTPGAGVVYRSTGLTLPDANQAELTPQSAVSAQFKYQAERTFARADIDARHKALVRQYFLVLEQRLNAQPQSTGTPQ